MSHLRGFTLLEVLAVIALLIVLASMSYPEFTNYLTRAREVACVGNMRSITTGLYAYLEDNDSIWPQGPSPENIHAWEDFWSKSLTKYGVDEATWQCPKIRSDLLPLSKNQTDIPKVHYTPTGFPRERGIAYRWSTQPWLIEKANAHGSGPLISFPDGSIKPLFKILAEQGVR